MSKSVGIGEAVLVEKHVDLNTYFKKKSLGVPRWLSELRVQHCHWCCGVGLTPGLRDFCMPQMQQTKKQAKNIKSSEQRICLLFNK